LKDETIGATGVPKGSPADILEGRNAVSSTSSVTQLPLLVIEPRRGLAGLQLGELWAYRELFYFLVWRDIKVRYKQTALGAAWAILQPLATAAVFTIFFNRIAGISSDGVPYPLFAFGGLLVWTFFAQGVAASSNSLVGSANLITKVYFPRLVVPVSSVLSGLVDLLVAFPLLIVMMALYGIRPGAAVLLLPLVVVLAFVSALGVGLWLSALCVRYRDVRHVVPFLVQLWLFVTPVIYPASKVGPAFARIGLPPWLLGLNPMAGVVEGFRGALFGAGGSIAPLMATSTAVALVLVTSATFYFRSVERSFADVV
jgi:homopolymeric O-antigen transport system permease protein